jgi:hypothetical protein
LKLALPLITCGAVGFDQAGAEAKQAVIATTIRRLRAEKAGKLVLGMMSSQYATIGQGR